MPVGKVRLFCHPGGLLTLDRFDSGHCQPAQHILQAYLQARPIGLCPPTQEAAPRQAAEEFQGAGRAGFEGTVLRLLPGAGEIQV